MPVLTMLAARGVFALAAQAALAGAFRIRGKPRPWQAAGGWWTVYGTAIDAASLVCLAILARREGTDPAGLIPDEGSGAINDLKNGLIAAAALAPAFGIAGIIQRAVGGDGPPPQIDAIRVPRWATAYSVLVWPAIWGITEELTYLGYALPRLEQLTHSTPIAATVVAIAWAAQHLSLPFIPGRRYLVSRVLTALPATAGMTALFLLNGRRLRPLMLAHWAVDLPTVLLGGLARRREAPLP